MLSAFKKSCSLYIWLQLKPWKKKWGHFELDATIKHGQKYNWTNCKKKSVGSITKHVSKQLVEGVNTHTHTYTHTRSYTHTHAHTHTFLKSPQKFSWTFSFSSTIFDPSLASIQETKIYILLFKIFPKKGFCIILNTVEKEYQEPNYYKKVLIGLVFLTIEIN